MFLASSVVSAVIPFPTWN